MNNYQILEAIGEGSFGKVFRGQCHKTGHVVALKFIPKRNKVERELKNLRKECEIQKELSHPNIVRMVDAFETEREVVAVSEYVPIPLCTLLAVHGTLPEERVQRIACNLISAIYYLHSLRILHRDIKPQNILINSDGDAKLCDFGFSRKMGFNTYVLTSVKGTPLYMAPELIDEKPYDHTADLWSLGCILFELLNGAPPFCTTSIVQLIKMVHQDSINWPAYLTKECKSFLEGLLQKDPCARSNWPDLLKHPWIKGGLFIISKTSLDHSHLTCPLSSSQEEIKEQQKRRLSQEKIMRTFYNNKVCVQPQNEDERLKELRSQRKNDCFSLSKLSDNIVNTQEKGFVQGKAFAHIHHSNKSGENLTQNTSKNGPNLLTTGNCSSPCNEGKLGELTPPLLETNSEKVKSEDESVKSNKVNNVEKSAEKIRENFSSRNKSVDFESFEYIELEEWKSFIDRSLVEVLNLGNFSLFHRSVEIGMFMTPLQNSSCPVSVVDKVAILFLLPFVAKRKDVDTDKVLEVYHDCKLIQNLVYSLKRIFIGKSSTQSMLQLYSEDEVSIVHSVISLICYLLHHKSVFISQFCDAISIFGVEVFGELLKMDVATGVLEKVLSIFNVILSHSDGNNSIIDQIFLSIDDICSLFDKLILNSTDNVCASTCFLIAHSAKRSCRFIFSLKSNPAFLSNLINLEMHQNESVKNAASLSVYFMLNLEQVV